MSNSYYILSKARSNAQAATTNTNRMAASIAEVVNQTANNTASNGFDTTNPSFQGLTTMYDTLVTNNATFDKAALFRGDVNFQGTVTGVNFNGVVTTGQYNEQRNAMLSSIGSNTTRIAYVENNVTPVVLNDLVPKVASLNASVTTLTSTVLNNTTGLVKVSADHTADLAILASEDRPRIGNALTRVTNLEASVNGVTSGGTTTPGLLTNMSNVQTRVTILEDDTNDLKNKVDGTVVKKGLMDRMITAEEFISAFDSKVQSKINEVVDGAPEKLNTLMELANELNKDNNESVVHAIFQQLSTKADKTEVVKLTPDAGVSKQVINGNVEFTGNVTGLKANLIPADAPIEFNDTSSVAAKLVDRVDLTTQQSIGGKKNFTDYVLLPDTGKILFGTDWNSAESLATKMSRTNISQTQNFENGLTVPDFSKITTSGSSTVNPGISLADEVNARLDTRLAAGKPNIESTPLFTNGVEFNQLDKVLFNSEAIGNTNLLSVLNRVKTSETNIVNINDNFANYVTRESNQTIQGIKTFGDQSYLVIDPDRLQFRSPTSNANQPTYTFSSLIAPDRLLYLGDGGVVGNTQEVTGSKKFSGKTEFAYNSIKFNRPDTSDSTVTVTLDAKDFLLNKLDNQTITGIKTVNGTFNFTSDQNLQIGSTTSGNYFVTTSDNGSNTEQTISGVKKFANDLRIEPRHLKLMIGGAGSTAESDVDANEYWVSRSTAQTISGKKTYTGGNGVEIEPSKLTFNLGGSPLPTVKTGEEYIVNRLYEQTIDGVKTFNSGIIFPMDTTYVKSSIGSTLSTTFNDYVVNRAGDQDITGNKIQSGTFTISAGNLKFTGADKPAESFLAYASTNNVVYMDGLQTIRGEKHFDNLQVQPSKLKYNVPSFSDIALETDAYLMNLYTDQSVRGTKTFDQTTGKLVIAPGKLTIKDGPMSTEKASNSYFVTSESEQTVSGKKTFTNSVVVEASKLEFSGVDAPASTLSDLVARTNIMYLGGEEQTITGAKKFTGTVTVDSSNVKVKMDNIETDLTAKSMKDAFVYTRYSGSEQKIEGDKIITGSLKFPYTAENTTKIHIPASQLVLYINQTDYLSPSQFTVDVQSIYTTANEAYTDAGNALSDLASLSTKVDGIKDNVDNLASGVMYLNKTGTSNTLQTIVTPIQMKGSNITFTDISSMNDNHTGDKILFLDSPYTSQSFSENCGFKINSSQLVFSDKNNSSLSTLLSGYFATSSTSDITISHIAQGSTTSSTVEFDTNKNLKVPESQLLIKESSTTNNVKDYVTAIANGRINLNVNKYVSSNAADITFEGDNGTSQAIKVASTSTVTIQGGTDYLYLGTDSLTALLSKKQDTGTYATKNDISQMATTVDLNNYLLKTDSSVSGQTISGILSLTGNFSISTGDVTIGSITDVGKTLTCNLPTTFKKSIDVSRMIENICILNAVSGNFTISASQIASYSVFLLKLSSSTNFTVTIAGLSPATGKSYTIALLIPVVSYKAYCSQFTFSDVNKNATVSIAGGTAGIDTSLSNMTHMLQTATFYLDEDVVPSVIKCISSVASFA